MPEKLACNQCGRAYTDQESIDLAVSNATDWKDSLARDGVQALGLCGCPDIGCSGEMVLIE